MRLERATRPDAGPTERRSATPQKVLAGLVRRIDKRVRVLPAGIAEAAAFLAPASPPSP